jgi:hypothetical protein
MLWAGPGRLRHSELYPSVPLYTEVVERELWERIAPMVQPLQ